MLGSLLAAVVFTISAQIDDCTPNVPISDFLVELIWIFHIHGQKYATYLRPRTQYFMSSVSLYVAHAGKIKLFIFSPVV